MDYRSLDIHSPANTFDGPEKVISPSPRANALWEKAHFTFEPLEVSDTELTIHFYCQPKQLRKQNDQIMLILVPNCSRWPTNFVGNGIARFDFTNCSILSLIHI